MNLELLLKYGPGIWRIQNDALGLYLRQQQSELAEVRRQVNDLNRERKLQQTAAGRELAKLEQEYVALVYKNMHIEGACRQLERETEAMRAAMGQQVGAEGAQQEQQENGEGAQGNGVMGDAAMTD
jgi:pre-mRNA-splicing factor SPF27